MLIHTFRTKSFLWCDSEGLMVMFMLILCSAMTVISRTLYWTSHGRMINYRKQKETFICVFRHQNRTKSVNNTLETFELFLYYKNCSEHVEIKHHAEQVQNSRGQFISNKIICSFSDNSDWTRDMCSVWTHVHKKHFRPCPSQRRP